MAMQVSDGAITSMEELRALVGQVSEGALRKDIGRLDEHCRAFIALSPFALLSTSGASGRCDVSPKGDAPGFALVLDEQTLALPDRPGNRRADSLTNIIENGHAGLLFLIPRMEETLRVNGRARLLRDPELLARMAVQGKPPQLAIVIDVEEAYLHCAKSLKRAKLWQPESWQEDDALPNAACIFADHARVPGVTADALERSLAESYKQLY